MESTNGLALGQFDALLTTINGGITIVAAVGLACLAVYVSVKTFQWVRSAMR